MLVFMTVNQVYKNYKTYECGVFMDIMSKSPPQA